MLVLLGAAAIVLRGCEYNPGIPLRYLAYFVLQVAIPGVVAVYLAQGRSVNVITALALAIPTGFAIEIFTFLALSALHLKSGMPLMPVAWIVLGFVRQRRTGTSVCGSDAGVSAGAALLLALVFLFTVFIAAGHLYAEAPLVHGLPQRPIFHDWMYLLSRAALIKHVWPLEDPSLVGTSLQYHYFLLVHVASASASTGLEPTWILLRLAVIPLGLVLTAQAFLLGKRITGQTWIGVLAATFMLLPGELSGASDYRQLTYLGFFLRWLFISPTFFFGLIFFGALLLVPLCEHGTHHRRLPWLALLAAAGTAAKGSVLPIIIVAMVLWILLCWTRDRRFPTDLALATGTLTVAFGAVYAVTMLAWGAGEAQWLPFRLCEISGFWQEHAIPITRFFKRSLHAPDLGTWLGRISAGLLVVGGTIGVQALAVPFVLGRQPAARRRLVDWLAAAVIASAFFGLMLHLDSDGEIYFLFTGRLPLAVLAAAACGQLVRFAFTARSGEPARRRGHRPLLLRLGAGAVLVGAAAGFAIQVASTIRCESPGWREWSNYTTSVRINDDLLPMYDAMRWLRENTEEDAVLISNAFTQPNLGRGRGVAVDHTTVGVHYYYSALTERRMWVEGPTYLLDQAEARHRLVASSRYFYHQQPLPLPATPAPVYIVLDHAIHDGAALTADVGARVYSNSRFEIYKAATTHAVVALK